MLFNRESLAPMYQLEVGQPGSSFTFELAEINGIGNNLIERAKGKLDTRRVELDGLLRDLHKEKSKLAKLTNKQLRAELEAEKATAAADRLKEAMKEKERNLNAQFDALNTARVRSTKLSNSSTAFNPANPTRRCLKKSRPTSQRKCSPGGTGFAKLKAKKGQCQAQAQPPIGKDHSGFARAPSVRSGTW